MNFYETKKIIKIIRIGAFIIIALFVLTSHINKNEGGNEETNLSFSKEALIEEIKYQKFKYPDLILAQAILESGNFTSVIFKKNNNLFGMRQPKKRYTLCNGSNLNYALYDNWKLSVEDRMIYDTLYLKNMNRNQYLKFLGNVYCKHGDYAGKLENIIKKNYLKEVFTE